MTETIKNFLYEATIRTKGITSLKKQIGFLFNETISLTTIKRQQKLLKLVWRRARKAPNLTATQRYQRLSWCKANLGNTFDNWIFPDESALWINECPIYV